MKSIWTWFMNAEEPLKTVLLANYDGAMVDKQAPSLSMAVAQGWYACNSQSSNYKAGVITTLVSMGR